MAAFKYFTTHQGQVIELTNVHHDGDISTKASHFIGRAPDGSKLRAERAIGKSPKWPAPLCAKPEWSE